LGKGFLRKNLTVFREENRGKKGLKLFLYLFGRGRAI